MENARAVLLDLAATLRDRVKAESSVTAYFSTRLLLDVKTLMEAVNHGRVIPPPDVERLVKLRNEIAHTAVSSSDTLAPFHQTLADIARKVA